MEALKSSSSKLVVDKSLNRAFSSTRALFTRHEIRFFPSQKLNHVGLSHSVSLQFKAIDDSTLSSSFSSETQADVGTAEALTPVTNQSKNVHVKFQLQKECLFGQQFLIVGDDPIFGLWDPANAIPLDWSDGHIWTVELDLPIRKSIQFKFILKGAMGEVVWQPGADRILQTWETKNTIIVSEDWEDVKVQKITEEEPVANPKMELMVNPNEESMAYMNKKPLVAENITCPKVEAMAEEVPMAYPNKEAMVNPNTESIVAENISNPKEEPMAYTNKKPLVAENITYPMASAYKELIFTENITYPKEEPKASVNKESMVAENKICPTEEPRANLKEEMIVAENILGSNGIAMTDKRPMFMKDEDRLVIYEGEPVLVPRLTPLPAIATGEALPKEVHSGTFVDASAGSDGPEDQNMPENPAKNPKHEKQEPDGNNHQGETTVMMSAGGPKEERPVNELEEKHHLTKQADCQTADDNVLQNDFQWGSKMLRKLLMNLGFISNQLN